MSPMKVHIFLDLFPFPFLWTSDDSLALFEYIMITKFVVYNILAKYDSVNEYKKSLILVQNYNCELVLGSFKL